MAATRETTAARPTGDYEVGYGKPPKHSQFKAGQSGNPRGRRKGTKNKVPAYNPTAFDDLIQAVANRPMTITDKGRPVTVPMMHAIVSRVAIDALQGRSRAQKLISDLVGGAERRSRALYEKQLAGMFQHKEEASAFLEKCRREGRTPPEIIPHPDDILIDPQTLEPKVFGPITAEQKLAWDVLAQRRDGAREMIAEWEAEIERTRSAKRREVLLEMKETASAKLQETLEQIGEWPNHRVSGPGEKIHKLMAMPSATPGSPEGSISMH